MGDIIEIYNDSVLKKINNKLIYDLVKSNIRFIPAKRRNLAAVAIQFSSVQKMLEFKKVLEYKYFLPIHYRWKYRELVFRGFSAYILLKLIKSYKKFRSPKKDQLNRIIEQTKDCFIPVYAAGAIEKSPDKGIGYRTDLKEAVESTKVHIVDPCDFEYNICGNELKTLTEFDHENSLLQSYFHTRTVVEGDCAAVVETEAVIALLDQYLGVGTSGEITTAVAFKRPVYGIIGQEIELSSLHPWTRCCVSRYFRSIEELKNFILATEEACGSNLEG
jgi:hypothetical protein